MGKHFLWDPAEDNIVKEIDDSGAAIADYTTEPYLYGDLISQHRDGQSSFYHYDGQGSTTSLTNSAANVTDIYAYSAFGEVTAQTGSTVNPFQYVGRSGYYSDGPLSYSVRRRSLSSRNGRWLSLDSLGQLLLKVNLYAYVHHRLLITIDPSGLEEQKGDPKRERTDPHTKEKKTIGESVCRSKARRKADQDKSRSRRPFANCISESCYAFVGEVWGSPRVLACRAALEEYKDNRDPEGKRRCGDILDNPPKCDLTCQYLALYYPGSHTISINGPLGGYEESW